MRNKNSKSYQICILTASMMRTYLTDETLLGEGGEYRLEDALRHSCNWALTLDRPGKVDRLIRAINILIEGGLREFAIYHGDICPYVEALLDRAIPRLKEVADENEEARKIIEHFSHRKVFVYGTLMRGQGNHDAFLEDDWYDGTGTACGFDMYDIGYYPGIVKGNGDVAGELYEVPEDAIKDLDGLEGEASLYLRECCPVVRADGSVAFAEVYVYNRSIDGLELAPKRALAYTWN